MFPTRFPPFRESTAYVCICRLLFISFQDDWPTKIWKIDLEHLFYAGHVTGRANPLVNDGERFFNVHIEQFLWQQDTILHFK